MTVNDLIKKLSALPVTQRSLPVGYYDEIWIEEVAPASIVNDEDGATVLVLMPDDPLPSRPRVF